MREFLLKYFTILNISCCSHQGFGMTRTYFHVFLFGTLLSFSAERQFKNMPQNIETPQITELDLMKMILQAPCV